MKGITSKQIEAYIYLQVILPLKRLKLESFSSPNPLQEADGRVTELMVQREEINGRDYQHNYQRSEARKNAKWLVYLLRRGNSSIVASYDIHNHNVKVYDDAFTGSKFGNILKGKLEDAFQSSYPFTKVDIVPGTWESNFVRPERVAVEADPYPQDYDDDDDEESWDDE